MQKKKVLITIFSFQLSMNIRFESAISFEIVYQGKSILIFHKKSLLNGKLKLYNTFTPIIQCLYNKQTIKFATKDLKLVLKFHTSKRETILGQFTVQMSKIFNNKQNLCFELSDQWDRSSFVEIGMQARFTDSETIFQPNKSRNFFQKQSSLLRLHQSNETFQRNNKRHFSSDRYLQNPEKRGQRLTQKQISRHASSTSKHLRNSQKNVFEQRLSNFGDSKRNFRVLNTSEQERERENLYNENRQLKRRCRQMEYELESMRSNQKSFQAQIEREKRKQKNKDMIIQEQTTKMNFKINQKQNQAKQYKTQLEKKASEYAQNMRQAQQTFSEIIKRNENDIAKLNKRLQKAQEKQQQYLKTIGNLEQKIKTMSRQSKQTKISYEQKCLEAAQSQQQNKKIYSKIQNAQLQRSCLQKQLALLREGSNQLISKSRLLAQENLSLKKDAESHAYSVVQTKKLIEQFKSKLTQSEQQLRESKRQMQKKNLSFDQLRQNYDQLSKQIKKRNNLIEQLAQINSKDDNKIKDMLKDIKIRDQQKIKQITSYRQALKNKQQKIQSLYKDKLAKERVLAKKDKLNDELRTQIQTKINWIKQLKQQIIRLQDQYWKETFKTGDLTQKVLNLSNELNQTRKKLQQTVFKLQKTSQTKQSHITELKQQLSQLNQQLLIDRQNLEDVSSQLQLIKGSVIPEFERKIKQLQEVEIERYKAFIKQQMDKISSKNQEILNSQKMINGLKTEIQFHKIQEQRLMTVIDTRQKQYEQSNLLLRQKYEQQITGLKDEQKDIKRDFQQEKDNYNQKIKKLELILKQKVQEIHSKQKNISQLEHKLSQAQNLNQLTNEKNSTLQQTLVKLNAQYLQLEKSKQQMSEHYHNSIQEKQQHSLSVVAKLEQSLKICQRKFAFAFQLVLALLNQLKNLSQNFLQLLNLASSTFLKQDLTQWTKLNYQADPSQANQSILKFSLQINQSVQQRLKNHLNNLKTQTQFQNQQISTLNAQISTLNSQKAQNQHHIEQLNKLISELNQQLFQYEKTNKKISAQSSHLQKDLLSYKEQAQSITKELLKTQNNKKTIQTSMKSLEQSLTRTLQFKQQQILSQSNLINQLKTQIKNLTQSNDRNVSKNQQITKNLLNLEEEVKNVSNQLKFLKTQNSTLQNTKQDMQNLIKSLESHIKSSKQQNESVANKLTVSKQSFKSLELSTQNKINQMQIQKQKLVSQISQLDKKAKAVQLEKKTKFARLNSNLETLTKQNEVYHQQLTNDKNTLFKIQQTTIELDKIIISLEKDKKISSTFVMPIKNILKKNEGIINVNLKNINELLATSKVTNPPSRISNMQNQSNKTKNDEKKKPQPKRSLKVESKSSIKKSEELSIASKNQTRQQQLNEVKVDSMGENLIQDLDKV